MANTPDGGVARLARWRRGIPLLSSAMGALEAGMGGVGFDIATDVDEQARSFVVEGR